LISGGAAGSSGYCWIEGILRTREGPNGVRVTAFLKVGFKVILEKPPARTSRLGKGAP
jgi:hypothetical protein